MTTLPIVIPAYNEEDGILAIITRVLAVKSKLQAVGIDDMELIVVDDGSADRTAETVLTQPAVRLLRHVKNGGYGAALKTGFAAAHGEWIGFLDADGTYPPEYFPQLYTTAIEQNADIVIGSCMAGVESQMPKVRRLGNLIFASTHIPIFLRWPGGACQKACPAFRNRPSRSEGETDLPPIAQKYSRDDTI